MSVAHPWVGTEPPLHAYYGVAYVEVAPKVWQRHSFACGSRIASTLGDARVWPADEHVPMRSLGLDYDPRTFDPPPFLYTIPTPKELGA